MSNMTERERLLDRLSKLRALADRGTGGEKANAEARLRYLMAKHGVSEDDLEDTKESTFFIPYKTHYEMLLIGQLAYMHLGPGHCGGCVGTQTGRRHKKVSVHCSPAKYIEIEADFDFYRHAWAEEVDTFYTAFLSKNQLFPPDELAGDSAEDEQPDEEQMAKISAMMTGIDHRTRNKALPPSET